MDHAKIGLSEAITALRNELDEAVADAAGRSLRFEVQSLELELRAAVTISGEGEAGIKWWLFDLRAKGGLEKENTQTIRIRLNPVRSDGGTSTPLLLSLSDDES